VLLPPLPRVADPVEAGCACSMTHRSQCVVNQSLQAPLTPILGEQ